MARRAALTRRRLAAQIGEAAAIDLMREWGGHCLPRLSPLHVKQYERDKQIVARVMSKHTTYRSVAAEFGLSESQVIRIAARL